jgi:hypothetical protein
LLTALTLEAPQMEKTSGIEFHIPASLSERSPGSSADDSADEIEKHEACFAFLWGPGRSNPHHPADRRLGGVRFRNNPHDLP